ncbi:DUF5320 domain-containing protein [Candidatus Oleimmundimicrobium sp.]|uniref:DUF5320 domain-containing protein n=1 Tax=Candidatus Oleimmundimicrobium sp. TaxID=3060597 RepID=UPI00271D02CD|nr:DUF5320 domain-containing protein [Candidatus Oleimmundimicrobium sp.]MDO8885622.1 DUF5320 domain-containing protein [Candidatus Oleimmundimicrobium sp.]
MPGFNGTGPRGEGPMTGGRRGNCSPSYGADYPSRPRGGFAPGGRGYRNMYYATGQPGWARFGYSPGRGQGAGAVSQEPGTEKELLKEEASLLKERLDVIEKRLNEIKESAE